MGEPTLAVHVAKAALTEAGRPDLAALVRPGRDGMPTHDHRRSDDPALVRKAFLIAHQTHDPGAHLDAGGGIVCACTPEEARHR